MSKEQINYNIKELTLDLISLIEHHDHGIGKVEGAPQYRHATKVDLDNNTVAKVEIETDFKIVYHNRTYSINIIPIL